MIRNIPTGPAVRRADPFLDRDSAFRNFVPGGLVARSMGGHFHQKTDADSYLGNVAKMTDADLQKLARASSRPAT